jgi:hypothetical protein
MDLPAMSFLLDCSQSAVRNYIFELLSARVIVGPLSAPPCAAGRKNYRLSGDELIVENFRSKLGELGRRDIMSAKHARKLHKTLADARYVHIMWDDMNGFFDVNGAHVRRDPLVAALFGEANMRFEQASKRA